MLRWLLMALLLFVAVMLLLLSLHMVTIRWAASASSVSVVLSVPVAPAASSPSSVVGDPSLSAHFVDAVLSAYHSPAVGLGQAMYDDSVRFGIDDVFALAFFWHESQFGRLGVAAVTHSVGNIVCSAGYSLCVGRFRSYVSWQVGCFDWFRLLATEYLPRGLTTVERIVPVYAPASENNVSAYIAAVLTAVTSWRAGRLEV